MHRYWDRGFNNMMNFDDGWFIFFNVLKVLFIIVLLILIVRMFIKSSNSQKTTNSSRAIKILKERYAAGEISDEEYESKLDNLSN